MRQIKKAVEQVNLLLAKAVSTNNEEEARTCSLIAARKIAEFKLEVVAQSATTARYLTSSFSNPIYPSNVDAFTDFYEKNRRDPSFQDYHSGERPRSSPPPEVNKNKNSQYFQEEEGRWINLNTKENAKIVNKTSK